MVRREFSSRAQDRLIYVLVRGFLAAIGVLPRFLAYAFCRSLATLVFLLDAKHRRVGMINLGIAFPEKNRRWRKKILLKSFQQLGEQVVEVSRLHRLTREEVMRRVPYEEGRGVENYLKVHRQNRSVLFLTGHLSAWELLPAAHALWGHPLSFVVRPLDNRLLGQWMNYLRTCSGNRVISKRGSMRSILRALKEGEDVGLLVDQNSQEKEAVYVPFFGRPASTGYSIAALALKTSTPIVPGFMLPGRRRGCYQIRFYPPVELVSSGDRNRDVREGMALLNGYIEEVIREYPHCWLWGHRRFQTQPDGSDLYRKTKSD